MVDGEYPTYVTSCVVASYIFDFFRCVFPLQLCIKATVTDPISRTTANNWVTEAVL